MSLISIFRVAIPIALRPPFTAPLRVRAFFERGGRLTGPIVLNFDILDARTHLRIRMSRIAERAIARILENHPDPRGKSPQETVAPLKK